MRYTHYFDVRVAQRFESDIEDFDEALDQWLRSFDTTTKLRNALLTSDEDTKSLTQGIIHSDTCVNGDPEGIFTGFATVDEVKAAFAQLDCRVAWIEPHWSAEYVWAVVHPSLGRYAYGFSSRESLLAWANEHLAPAKVGEER